MGAAEFLIREKADKKLGFYLNLLLS
jgi:hypothetical protein